MQACEEQKHLAHGRLIHNLEYLSVLTSEDPQEGEKDDLGNVKPWEHARSQS